MKPILYCLGLACVISTASSALATKTPVFDTSPVALDVLAASYGTYSQAAFVTNERPIAREGSLSAMRYSGEVSRLIMDNWWTDVGATLIADSVRNATPNP